MTRPRTAAPHAPNQPAPATTEETDASAGITTDPQRPSLSRDLAAGTQSGHPTARKQLSQILERFAQANGFSAERPLDVAFGRGTLGLHRFSRAADIYAIGGKGLGQWAQEWNAAMRQATGAPNPQERARLVGRRKHATWATNYTPPCRPTGAGHSHLGIRSSFSGRGRA